MLAAAPAPLQDGPSSPGKGIISLSTLQDDAPFPSNSTTGPTLAWGTAAAIPDLIPTEPNFPLLRERAPRSRPGHNLSPLTA